MQAAYVPINGEWMKKNWCMYNMMHFYSIIRINDCIPFVEKEGTRDYHIK
jgi:hypothetical protein